MSMEAGFPLIDLRYQILDALGQGASGRVYRTWDNVTSKHVAIKRYDSLCSPSSLALRQRFWRWARLTHPNLAKVLDFGIDADGTPLLVMELVDGQDLAQVSRTRRLAPEQVTGVVRDALRGLAYLHDRGLVHGDIKPGNCLLTPEGVKLVDWEGDGLGTLAYMRPERLHGAQPAIADDLYALGMVGLELLLDTPITQVAGARDMLRLLKDTWDLEAVPLPALLADLVTGAIPDAASGLAQLDGATGEPTGGLAAFRAEVPLIARGETLERLRDAVKAPQKQTGAWIVWGEAGVGKSRLVRELLASEGSPTTLAGHCTTAAQGSMQPWREALLPLAITSPPSDPLIGEWLGKGTSGDKQTLFEGIALWLETSPEVWILLEDIQWADQNSLELAVHLASRFAERQETCRLVLTSRPAEQVLPLLEMRRVETFRLAPLDFAQSAELLASHLGAPAPDAFVQWALELTAGNPLHLGELAAHLMVEGHIQVEAGTARFPTEPPAGSPGLQGLVRNLAARFSPDAQQLLLWGTVLGKRFTIDLLHRASGWQEERLFAAIDELREGRFWVQRQHWLDFRHDRLRESMVDAWPPEQVRASHLAAARLLEREGASPGLLAMHFDLAEAWEEALSKYIDAGDRHVAEGAMGDATAAWKRSLEILDALEGTLSAEAPPEAVSQARFDVWERLGVAVLGSDMVLGLRILERLRRRLLAEAPLERNLKVAMAGLGVLNDQAMSAPYRLSKPGQAPRSQWPLILLKYQLYSFYEAMCRVLVEGPPAAETCLAEAEALLPASDHWLKGVLEVPRCTMLAWEDRHGEAGQLGIRAITRMDEAPATLASTLMPVRLQAMVYQIYADGVIYARCPEDLHEAFLNGTRTTRRFDLESVLREVQMGAIGSSGSWPDFLSAESRFERALERAGLPRTILAEGSCQRMDAWFEQGHWAHVASQAEAFTGFLRGTAYETWYSARAVMALCATGRAEEGAALLARIEAESPCRSFGFLLAKAWVAVARGSADAELLVEEALAREGVGRYHHGTRAMWSLRLRAELAVRSGYPERAQDDLAQALSMADLYGNRLQRAITLYWMGRLERNPGIREEHFVAAETLFDQLGNPHYPALIRRARAERWWVLTEGTTQPLPDVRGVESTLRTVVERAMSTARADRGKLLLLEIGGEMTTRISLARPGVPEVESHSHTVARYVVESGQSLWLADVTNDTRFQRGVSLVALDLRTVICVPLIWGDRLRGLLYLDRQEASAAFTKEDFHLVEALAGYGALALAHAEMAEEEAHQRKQAETLLNLAKALRGSDPEQLRNDVATLATDALGCRSVTVGSGPETLQVTWGCDPTNEQEALAVGIAELAAVAIERAEAQAREAESRVRTIVAEQLTLERETLIHQILHDLRNPVQAIALMNMDLAHWAKSEPDAASSVAAIGRQVAFISRFLEQKLSRLAKGADTHEAQLRSAFDEIKNRFEPLCRAKTQSLSIILRNDARVPLPEVELAQVLGNLVDNAHKFTPEGGRIVIEGHAADGWAIITVRDSGPGFSRTSEASSKGYGMGLDHVRGLVRQAAGWMTVDDGAEGAIVRVGLPTLDGETARALC